MNKLRTLRVEEAEPERVETVLLEQQTPDLTKPKN